MLLHNIWNIYSNVFKYVKKTNMYCTPYFKHTFYTGGIHKYNYIDEFLVTKSKTDYVYVVADTAKVWDRHSYDLQLR